LIVARLEKASSSSVRKLPVQGSFERKFEREQIYVDWHGMILHALHHAIIIVVEE
jgi:hypothetical protein